MNPELVFAAEPFEGDMEFEEVVHLQGGSGGPGAFRAELAFEQAGGISRQSAAYIRWVQQSLNKVLGLRLAEDGVTGVRTRSAVRSFQQKRGLSPDGDVGPKTEAALIAAGAPPLPGTTTPGPTRTGGVNPRIDAHAQESLHQMSKINHAPIAGLAQAMLADIQSEGNLVGIYRESHEVSTRLAERLKRARGQLIPEVADAIVAVNPVNPTSPALVVFRDQIRHDTARLGFALLKAWSTLQQARNLPAEFKRAAREKAARDRPVAEAEFLDFTKDILDMVLPVMSYQLPTIRSLTQDEVNVAKPVFGASLDYGRVIVSPLSGFDDRPFVLYVPSFDVFGGALALFGRGVTVLNMGPTVFKSPATVTSPEDYKAALIHELVHSWQSQHHPIQWQYETNSVTSQFSADLYNSWTSRDADAYCYRPGGNFASYAAEQIAESVENGFLDKSGTHQSQIMSHIAAVPAGATSPLNVASLMSPRWEIRSAPGVTC